MGSIPIAERAIRSFASPEGIIISEMFTHFIPLLSKQQHATFSALVNKFLMWNKWIEKMVPRSDLGEELIINAMATNSHFSVRDAEIITRSIPAHGGSILHLFRDTDQNQGREHVDALIVLCHSLLCYDVGMNLYVVRPQPA